MKEFFCEFLKILADCVLVICFALCSFLLILNLFHFNEISYGYNIDLSNDVSYSEYKKSLVSIDKKMNSVNYSIPSYSTTAKPIYEYYKACVNSLNKGSFNNFDSKTYFNTLDIYNVNNDIVNDYGNLCAFSLAYNISVIDEKSNFDNDFDVVMEEVHEKREILLDNANYIINSELANSSYHFSTDMFRNGVFNQLYSDYRLTLNNYEMIASILDDIADWYVLEFGGNVR